MVTFDRHTSTNINREPAVDSDAAGTLLPVPFLLLRGNPKSPLFPPRAYAYCGSIYLRLAREKATRAVLRRGLAEMTFLQRRCFHSWTYQITSTLNIRRKRICESEGTHLPSSLPVNYSLAACVERRQSSGFGHTNLRNYIRHTVMIQPSSAARHLNSGHTVQTYLAD